MLGITQLDSPYTNIPAPKIRIRSLYIKTKLPEKPQYKKKHDLADYHQLIQVNQLHLEQTHYQPKKPYSATAIKRNTPESHSLTTTHRSNDKMSARYVPKSDSYDDIARFIKKYKKKCKENVIEVRQVAVSTRLDKAIEQVEKCRSMKHILPVLNIQAFNQNKEDSISEDEDFYPFPLFRRTFWKAA